MIRITIRILYLDYDPDTGSGLRSITRGLMVKCYFDLPVWKTALHYIILYYDGIVSQLLCTVTRRTHLCQWNRLNLWRHSWSSAVNFYYPLYELMQDFHYRFFEDCGTKWFRNITKWNRASPIGSACIILYPWPMIDPLNFRDDPDAGRGLRSFSSAVVCSLRLTVCLVLNKKCPKY